MKVVLFVACMTLFASVFGEDDEVVGYSIPKSADLIIAGEGVHLFDNGESVTAELSPEYIISKSKYLTENYKVLKMTDYKALLRMLTELRKSMNTTYKESNEILAKLEVS